MDKPLYVKKNEDFETMRAAMRIWFASLSILEFTAIMKDGVAMMDYQANKIDKLLTHEEIAEFMKHKW
jgi:hypothetical protein